MQATASLTLPLNSPPFGGTIKVSPTPPYFASTTDIAISGEQWFDDAADLPLTYAFYYVNAQHAGEDSSWTALGEPTLSNRKIWRKPPEGEWVLSCHVIDVFGAATLAQQAVSVQAVGLSLAFRE